MKLLVWVDPDFCTGSGLCEQLVPEVFVDRGDGVWTVREAAKYFGTDRVFGEPGTRTGAQEKARVPAELAQAVIDMALECPGECIFVEPCK